MLRPLPVGAEQPIWPLRRGRKEPSAMQRIDRNDFS